MSHRAWLLTAGLIAAWATLLLTPVGMVSNAAAPQINWGYRQTLMDCSGTGILYCNYYAQFYSNSEGDVTFNVETSMENDSRSPKSASYIFPLQGPGYYLLTVRIAYSTWNWCGQKTNGHLSVTSPSATSAWEQPSGLTCDTPSIVSATVTGGPASTATATLTPSPTPTQLATATPTATPGSFNTPTPMLLPLPTRAYLPNVSNGSNGW